jgi:hypothetical protein
MIPRIMKSEALGGVSLGHRKGSHGEGLREGAKNLSPISGFGISKDREWGELAHRNPKTRNPEAPFW